MGSVTSYIWAEETVPEADPKQRELKYRICEEIKRMKQPSGERVPKCPKRKRNRRRH